MKWLVRKIKKITRFITGNYSKPIEDYGSHGSDLPEFTPRWGVIIPHTVDGQGAHSREQKDLEGRPITEYVYGFSLMNNLKLPYYTRNSGGVSGAAKLLKRDGCNASLEPHKNAFNTKAKGFEILVIKGDHLSAKYAEEFAAAFKAKFPDRVLRHGNGVKPVVRGQNGYRNLVNAKKNGMEVALLSESFFIDNKNEWIEPETMAEFWKETLGQG